MSETVQKNSFYEIFWNFTCGIITNEHILGLFFIANGLNSGMMELETNPQREGTANKSLYEKRTKVCFRQMLRFHTKNFVKLPLREWFEEKLANKRQSKLVLILFYLLIKNIFNILYFNEWKLEIRKLYASRKH